MDRLNEAILTVRTRCNWAAPICTASLFLLTGAAYAQSIAWSRSFDSSYHGDDLAVSTAVDGSNDVYVLGDSKGPNGYDILLIKYDSDGTRLWAYRLDGPAHKNDRAAKVVIGGDDNILLTGYSIAGNGYPNLVVAKVAPTGNLLWSRTYDDPGHGPDYPWDMTVDGSGGIYVAGATFTAATNLDYLVVKYDANGNRQWLRRYDGFGTFKNDEATAIDLDTAQNVLVTGYSYNPGRNAFDYITSKYTSGGSLLWRRRFPGASAQPNNYPSSLVTDSSNNVIVFGTQVTTSTGQDWQLVKYGPTGTVLWHRLYNDGVNGDDISRKAAVDANGNILLIGVVAGAGGYPDWMTMKYAPNGTRLWYQRYSADGGRDDVPNDLIVDSGSNAIVTGFGYGADGDYDCVTIKYNLNGQRVWLDRFGVLGRTEWGTSLALDSLSNIIVAGSSATGSTDGNILTIKYKP